MKPVAFGVSYYSEINEKGLHAVDKTMMIAELLEKKRTVTVVTRPRRFGKTMNMSMMAEFFDITKDSKEMFKDTAIMKTEYAGELNQWPTIFLSFASVKGNKRAMVKGVKKAIMKEWQRYKFVFESVDEFDMPYYKYTKENLLVVENDNIQTITDSICLLMEYLEKYYHKKVMVFIDEYDRPLIESHVFGYYHQVRDAFTALLQNSLKLSQCLQYAFLTGTQSVTKANTFSGLNNVTMCSMADEQYAQYFGFTAEETKELLEAFGMELTDEVRAMYGGYLVGGYELFNPWSIINYIDHDRLKRYWINFSANLLIRNGLSGTDEKFRALYKQLQEVGYIDTTISLDISFYDRFKLEDLWGLLINAGFLTIESEVSEDVYRLKFPNTEAYKEFDKIVYEYLPIWD